MVPMMPADAEKYFLPHKPNIKKEASGSRGINAIKIGLFIDQELNRG